MPITLKAFGSNLNLVNNAENSVARLGELAPVSRGFTRRLREYSETPFPGIVLNLFYAAGSDGKDVNPLDNYTTRLLEIIAWCYDRATVTSNTTTSQDFLVALANRFDGVISAAGAGSMVAASNRRMPASLSFAFTPDGLEAVNVRLWFADTEFQAEYDSYELEVIHPVSNLNVFTQSLGALTEAVKARPLDTMLGLVGQAKKGALPTEILSHTVRWYSQQNGQQFDVTWFVLVYGARGNTTDNINAAIRRALLDQTTIGESAWKLVLPDLFRVTRFYIAPNWKQRAIPNRTSIPGIYSPLLKLSDAKGVLYGAFPALASAENDARIEFMVHPFRSIGLVVLPGLENRDDAQSLQQVAPDYIGQDSLMADDYNRQTEATKQWVTLLGSAIRLAENFGISVDTIPLGLDIVSEGGKRCVRVKIAGVEYVVLCQVEVLP